MRWIPAAAIAAAVTIALGAPSEAAADALPSGSIGVVGGVSQGAGAASSTFGLGALLGASRPAGSQ